MLHGFIHIEQKKQTSKPKRKVSVTDVKLPVKQERCGEITIADLVSVAKVENVDIVQLLKEHITVMEVAV